MKREMERVLGGILLAVIVGGSASAAGAQTLVDQRLFLEPTGITRGTGTVRLDGMGGFEAAVSDENFELSAYDFSRNPAAFGDDRDSWSIDMRYTHNELVERGDVTGGDDVKINDGTLLVGYHAPGNIGVGGRIDYAEATTSVPLETRNDYKLAGLELLLSKYLFENLSVGVNVSSRTEEEGIYSQAPYKIAHDNSVTRGGLGLIFTPAAGVVVGARGELVSTQLDGESRGPFHTDFFDWSRPGGLVSVHGFVNRGRLEAGVDYTRQEIQGEESVVISWSTRFQFNPISDTFHLETDTFTEDRVDEGLRARAKLHVIPGRLAVSAAVRSHKQTAEVLVNPNVVGSEPAQDLETTLDSMVGGVSWIGLRDRLLLAAEIKVSQVEVDGTIDTHPISSTTDLTLVRAGGEYLVGEVLVARGGIVQAQESFKFVANPDLNGDFSSTYVAVGMGVVPEGAIWQLDLAYDVAVSSDLDTDRSRFSAYIKYLF